MCGGGGGQGCLDIFTLLYIFSPLSPSLWEMAGYKLKYCLKGPLKTKQPFHAAQFISGMFPFHHGTYSQEMFIV